MYAPTPRNEAENTTHGPSERGLANPEPAQAKGNTALALLLTVGSNLLGSNPHSPSSCHDRSTASAAAPSPTGLTRARYACGPHTGVATVPFMLKLVLSSGGNVKLDAIALLIKLALTILAPLAIGKVGFMLPPSPHKRS